GAACAGGRTTMDEPLGELRGYARRLGMLTTVTSNGMLLDGRRLAALRGGLDLLAISLDGVPASHNRLRAHGRAFEVMEARLDEVRASGIPFGFIFTLTQYNLHELPWVAEFVLRQGARLLQIHPLEEAGRAAHQLAGARPDGIEMSFAVLAAADLRARFGDQLYVQLDVVDGELLRAQ